MPIRPEKKRLYPDNWVEISRRIRFERAGSKCEWCGAPHLTYIVRHESDGTYMLPGGGVRDENTGEYLGLAKGSDYDGRAVRIILTVAHLNHDPTDNRDENLAALCQQCHLRYDAKQKAKERAERANEMQGELFAGLDK